MCAIMIATRSIMGQCWTRLRCVMLESVVPRVGRTQRVLASWHPPARVMEPNVATCSTPRQAHAPHKVSPAVQHRRHSQAHRSTLSMQRFDKTGSPSCTSKAIVIYDCTDGWVDLRHFVAAVGCCQLLTACRPLAPLVLLPVWGRERAYSKPRACAPEKLRWHSPPEGNARSLVCGAHMARPVSAPTLQYWYA